MPDSGPAGLRKQELHNRYFEPLSEVAPSLAALEAGPPVKKLLFMTDPAVISGHVEPYWEVLAPAPPPPPPPPLSGGVLAYILSSSVLPERLVVCPG